MVRMHELSVALSLVEGVEETAVRRGLARVTAVHVRIGTLSGIARDALAFSWNLATAGTLAADSALVIEDVPVTIFCERCECERKPRAAAGFRCATCGAMAPRIVHGRELQLVALEFPE